MLKYRKNTESKNPKVVKTINGRIMLLSKCVVWEGKKSRIIKEQGTNGFLSSLGIKATLSKMPLVGPLLLFGINKLIQGTKRNEIVNRFLLA